jgi:hypothetical protein
MKEGRKKEREITFLIGQSVGGCNWKANDVT